MLKVKLPKRLEKALVVPTALLRDAAPGARARRRGSAEATRPSQSPIVGPEKPPAPPRPPVADPNGDCDGDGQVNRVDTDDDNDLLSDALEKRLRLDSCKADTDGDGVEDGYEYQSARDLNDDEHQEPQQLPARTRSSGRTRTRSTPDGNTDHDGDDLTLRRGVRALEVHAQNGAPRRSSRSSYSAGEQYSLRARFGGAAAACRRSACVGYDKQDEFLELGRRAGDPDARRPRRVTLSSRSRRSPSGGTAARISRHPRP